MSRSFSLSALFSDAGMRRLYEERQASRPTEGHRTRTVAVLLCALLLLMFSALFSFVWVQKSETRFLESQGGVALLSEDTLGLRLARVPRGACGDERACYEALRAAAPVFEAGSLLAFDFSDAKKSGRIRPDDVLMISGVVPAAAWAKIAPRVQPTGFVVGLPAMRYVEARGYVDGALSRTFPSDEPLGIGFVAEPGARRSVRFDLVLRPEVGAPELLKVSGASYQIFLAEHLTYQRYIDHVAAKRVGAGKQLADIARIVLAIFALFLFLLIDSSPESLGLAIFMGFKAIGVILAQSWLPRGLLPPESAQALRAFALCFGDVMQLYFFVQLARVARPRLKPWLLWGGVIATLYALGVHLNSRAFDVDWAMEIWRWRNIVIGIACLVVAMAGASYCVRNRLYPRAAAMALAASGTTVQIVYPTVHLFPTVFHTDLFQSLYHVWEMHTPYAFALAAFVNISTLERRVRRLSTELAEARRVESENAVRDLVRVAVAREPVAAGELRVLRHEGAPAAPAVAALAFRSASGDTAALAMLDLPPGGIEPLLLVTAAAAVGSALWESDGTSASARAPAAGAPPPSRLAAFAAAVAAHAARIAHPDAFALTAVEVCMPPGGVASITILRGTTALLVVLPASERVPSGLVAASTPASPSHWQILAPVGDEADPWSMTLPRNSFVVLHGAWRGVEDLEACAAAVSPRLSAIGPALDDVLLKEAILAVLPGSLLVLQHLPAVQGEGRAAA